MSFAKKYLAKQDKRFFAEAPDELRPVQMIVVIPCFNEPDISYTLKSLFKCTYPGNSVAIAVVINDAENSDQTVHVQNQQTLIELRQLENQSPEWISVHSIDSTHLPYKHAGVGWARKIGMDWAVSHFSKTNNPDGIIVSLDADALVALNYFEAIVSYYNSAPQAIGATLYFEHPIGSNKNEEAIILYELYMRYYKHALEYTGFPHSIYTIGSCFTVKANAYVSQGGMNRRKAGEDFYFLHKLMPFGKIGNINTTTVYPSSRLSNRVPFGTGPALQKYLDGNRELEQTFPLQAFLVLKNFFSLVDSFYTDKNLIIQNLSKNIQFQNFLLTENFMDELQKLISNCSNGIIFRKRFFHIFNAFKILKWLNYSTCHGYKRCSLVEEAHRLLEQNYSQKETFNLDAKILLKFYRYLDKNI